VPHNHWQKVSKSIFQFQLQQTKLNTKENVCNMIVAIDVRSKKKVRQVLS